MRLFLSVSSALLLSAMLAEPVLAKTHGAIVTPQDLSLVALGLAGVLLGQRGGRRLADS